MDEPAEKPPRSAPADQREQPSTDPASKAQSSPVFMHVINELNQHQDQLSKRQNLIREIEQELTSLYGAENRLVSYIFRFGHPRSMMMQSDVPSLADILSSVSGAEQINMLLHGPGGDATVVEKMVNMCRSHLSGDRRVFRVIVPNVAKSAATVLALGADKILMGYCSELGPIDPQVQIAVSGVAQWVSALAFVESRDKLMEQIAQATKEKKPTIGLLQQLSGLNIPFTEEMENWIGFAKKTAAALLEKYMLRSKFRDPAARRAQADRIAEKLLSKQLFPVHGQFIDGPTAQSLGLEVEMIGKNDPLWNRIWEYYVRCEVQMNMPIQPPAIKVKLFESAQMSLVAQDSAT